MCEKENCLIWKKGEEIEKVAEEFGFTSGINNKGFWIDGESVKFYPKDNKIGITKGIRARLGIKLELSLTTPVTFFDIDMILQEVIETCKNAVKTSIFRKKFVQFIERATELIEIEEGEELPEITQEQIDDSFKLDKVEIPYYTFVINDLSRFKVKGKARGKFFIKTITSSILHGKGLELKTDSEVENKIVTIAKTMKYREFKNKDEIMKLNFFYNTIELLEVLTLN